MFGGAAGIVLLGGAAVVTLFQRYWSTLSGPQFVDSKSGGEGRAGRASLSGGGGNGDLTRPLLAAGHDSEAGMYHSPAFAASTVALDVHGGAGHAPGSPQRHHVSGASHAGVLNDFACYESNKELLLLHYCIYHYVAFVLCDCLSYDAQGGGSPTFLSAFRFLSESEYRAAR